MNRNAFLRSRRFRYGSAATALTIAFIAIVVIFNIIFTALAQKYMWYVDMTKEQVFTLSEEAKELMSDITEDVYIHFASEPDELMTGTNASFTRYIYTTALQLQEAFPNVHVDAVSVLKNPSYFREFYDTNATDIDTTSVVIESGGESRVIYAQAFFTFNDASDLSTVWAYNGEKRMISAIMQVTQTEQPIVSIVTEHGEKLESIATFAQLFADNGFTVNAINLAQEEIDDDCRILIIYDPTYDFIGAEAEDPSRNEIEKIDKFLDRYGWLPRKLTDISPFHTSFFLTNMGSIGLDAVYHHIYEFGTLSVFGAIGRKRVCYELQADGSTKRCVKLKMQFVVDERAADGFAYSVAFRKIRSYIMHPEALLSPPEKIEFDKIDKVKKKKKKKSDEE